jgi:hypothetical protein
MRRWATTTRAVGDTLSMMSGPFAETNEQIEGLVLIEARDLDEVVQLTSRIQSANGVGLSSRLFRAG